VVLVRRKQPGAPRNMGMPSRHGGRLGGQPTLVPLSLAAPRRGGVRRDLPPDGGDFPSHHPRYDAPTSAATDQGPDSPGGRRRSRGRARTCGGASGDGGGGGGWKVLRHGELHVGDRDVEGSAPDRPNVELPERTSAPTADPTFANGGRASARVRRPARGCVRRRPRTTKRPCRPVPSRGHRGRAGGTPARPARSVRAGSPGP